MIKKILSILDWDLWHRLKGGSRPLDTDYKFKKEEKMKTKIIEVCVGIGANQFFPEYVRAAVPVLTKKEREKLLANMMKGDVELGIYSDQAPCKFDHNGECLICDAWPDACAHQRYLKGDYSIESKEELEKMFNGKV